MLNVSHCMFYKVVAVGFNTLCYDASVGVLNPRTNKISHIFLSGRVNASGRVDKKRRSIGAAGLLKKRPDAFTLTTYQCKIDRIGNSRHNIPL